ncbi:MAG: hypothetical protein P4M11_04410 [Candidatus Pacebacteria bacterium]|nr:hypothetical protein [Candidatus Paceibacterota bacterium]
MNSLVEICKRIFGCPKSDLKPLGHLLELIVKIVAVFSTLRENRIYLLVTNKLIVLVEFVAWWFTNPNAKTVFSLQFLPSLFQVLAAHIKQKVEREQMKYKDGFVQYIYCYGLATKVKARLFQLVNGPLDLTDSKNVIPSLLLSGTTFLEALTMYTCIEYVWRIYTTVDRRSAGRRSTSQIRRARTPSS